VSNGGEKGKRGYKGGQKRGQYKKGGGENTGGEKKRVARKGGTTYGE